MTQSRWAVLLCKFSQDISSTLPVEHYKRLFTGEGTGSLNITDFFHDVTHGKLDLTKSEVHGWFTIPIKNKAEYDSFDAQHLQDPSIPQSRVKLMQVARKTAADNGIDLNTFDGLVVCMNGPMDIWGVIGGMEAAFDSGWGLRPSIMGQEMGHGYGLDHSRLDGLEVDYQDSWDIMSTDNADEAVSAEYKNVGPGLNAANMRSRGWLDESRVFTTGNSDYDTTIQLRPLHRHDLPGLLAADIGGYLVEYRKQERWDAGIPRSAVLLHRFQNNHSYLMLGNAGHADLVAGETFGTLTPANPYDIFASYSGLEVISIDDANNTATIRLVLHRGYQMPQIGGSTIGGVDRDGDGGIVINGILHRIPPWDPWVAVLEQAVAYRSASVIEDVAARLAAQRSALNTATRSIAALAAQASSIRTPALARTPSMVQAPRAGGAAGKGQAR